MQRRGRQRTTGLVVGVLAAWSFAACLPAGGEPDTSVVAPRTRAPDPRAAPGEVAGGPKGLARQLLATLAVADRDPRTGYTREQFGPSWADVDRNGCDTRNDILRRDLTDTRVEAGTRDCVIAAGRLVDPYTAAALVFEKGRGSAIDIDHVVALGDAWVTGAATWDPRKRAALANDPLNLLAVDASANRAKRDADAATWLPPEPGARCEYVARQIAVKAKYGLWVTADERDAMARVLERCPDQPAPVGDAPTLAPTRGDAPRRDAPASAGPGRDAAAPARKTDALDPDYGTCKQARAHGAGPYHRDRDPEYRYYRDADGDGVVCE